MTKKLAAHKHIRQQLEADYQAKYNNRVPKKDTVKKYQGLGLNWRDVVILIMALLFVGLYQVQAHAEDYFDLDDIDAAMMLSYHKGGNNYAALELLNSEYNINITGIIAEVTIKQTFINSTANWIEEGMYAFPVAKNAAVYDMKLIIGKRVIAGEIHEKQQAQQIYETAKAQGLAASIVKQYRPNLFTTDVANIMPNEKIQVEITYQQTLTYDAGYIDFRLPLAIKSRYMSARYLQEDEIPVATVLDNQYRAININLEAGFELSELKSLYHDVNIQANEIYQTITLNDTQLYDANDFVLRWQPVLGSEPQAAMFSEKLNGEEYVLMMLLPPNSTQKNEQPREVVFIIDTSGSMHGNALNAAKDALLFGLTQITPNDKFNIIEFNSYARELFNHSVLANVDNLDKAIDFIDELKSDGGTNMAPALKLAMQDKILAEYLKQIIFITDGSVGNEAQLFNQINQQIDEARLFTVAIGAAPNNYFMSKAALIGRGTYTNIGKLNEVDAMMNELFTKLSSPALTDVMVQWNTAVEQNPRVIPDLYSDQPIIVTAKMPSFDMDVALSGFANKKTWSSSFSFKQDGQSKGVAKLWARNQIEDLTDDYMLGADIDASLLQQQITDIALKYHLVSKFTSLVAVDKTPELSRLVAQQARAMHQSQALETIEEVYFPQTALGWRWQMLLGLILIVLALLNRKLLA
ncbi:Inter-alpha-trypsin inhibitor domain protein [hydrothermal vent metagenome]|uniref:Inter-alpha-trypsin inhibitor domain protein n=1 Tax=hydrothermal vent metagenome TaxID=652676 RepID=A0A3B0UUJ9_9ZZZZ